jgi:hypothetical protein
MRRELLAVRLSGTENEEEWAESSQLQYQMALYGGRSEYPVLLD